MGICKRNIKNYNKSTKNVYIAIIVFMLILIAVPSTATAAADRPTLLISEFSTNPNPVVPGQEFTLDMELNNVGNRDARKITITVNTSADHDAKNSIQESAPLQEGQTSQSEAPSSIFSPTKSGNTLYMDKIQKSKKARASIKMIAPGDIKPGVYNLNLSIAYDDNGRNSYNISQTIGVMVSQQDSLKIVSVLYPAQMKVGEKGEVTAHIANLGNAALRGINIDITGNINVQPASQYFGTFEGGDDDEFSAEITAQSPGKLSGQIKVTYYDQFNHQQELKKDISINVTGNEEIPDKSKSKGGFWSGIVSFFKVLLGLGDKS